MRIIDIDTFYFVELRHTTAARFEDPDHLMFNNMKNIYICMFSEKECAKIKVASSQSGVNIKNKAIDIRKIGGNHYLRFTVKDSRINIYVEWINPKSKEEILTRLRIVNGKKFT